MKKNLIKFCRIMIMVTIIVMAFHNFPVKTAKSLGNNFYEQSPNFAGSNQIVNETSYQKQWIQNPTFTNPVESEWSSSISGDNSDVLANSNSNQANYQVIGDQKTFSLVADPPKASNWTAVENPAFPTFPDTYEITPAGCYVSHYWNEGSDQSPSVNWDHNVSMPVNMSDYTITSASLTAVVNATVRADSIINSQGVDTTGGIDVPGDNPQQHSTYDYARFYVDLSDTNKTKTYEAAHYQTVTLGKNSAGTYDYLPDTYMITVPEDSLIFFLSSVLSSDYRNFTVTLGIRIWSEDNYPTDADNWTSLIIRSCNLTFSYEKIINQFTSISWGQTGNSISANDYQVPGSTTSIEVNNATLFFDYKINSQWSNSSPNSEIRIYIDKYLFGETVKLSSATEVYQAAKLGGFDVTSLIQKDINITLSLQLFIADKFLLDRNLTVSIDNVYLNISYTVTVKTPLPAPSFPPYSFGNDTIGQPPNGISLSVQDSKDSGSVTVENSGGIQQNYVEISKTGSNDRVYLKDNVAFAGNSYSFGQVRFKINHDNSLFSVILEGSKGRIAQLDFWNGTVGNNFNKENYTTYIPDTWLSVTIYFDIGRGWYFNINNFTNNSTNNSASTVNTTIGEGYNLNFVTVDPGNLENVIWTSGQSSTDIGYMKVDDISYDFTTTPLLAQSGPDYRWVIYTLGGVILGLVVVFGAYQGYFKYPPMVRKIRSIKKQINRNKFIKQTGVTSRESIMLARYNGHTKILEEQTIKSSKSPTSREKASEKISPAKGIVASNINATKAPINAGNQRKTMEIKRQAPKSPIDEKNKTIFRKDEGSKLDPNENKIIHNTTQGQTESLKSDENKISNPEKDSKKIDYGGN